MQYSIGIDGPAGAGKSTVAKAVAKRLGIPYLDTGAMYRAIAVYFQQHGVAFTDTARITALTGDADISVHYENGEQRLFADGVDVTALLRTEEIGRGASLVSAVPAVRDKLASMQRAVAMERPVVMDGRDICTNVLPDTPYKFFVTASAQERAKRRCRQLEQNGEAADYDKILADIVARDKQDSERAYKPLYCGADTTRIDTTALTIEQAVDTILAEVATCSTCSDASL